MAVEPSPCPVALVDVVAVVVVKDAEAGLLALALGAAAGCQVLIVAGKVHEIANGAIPGEANAHDRAVVGIVALVVDEEANRIVAARNRC